MINPFVTSGYAGEEYFCDRVVETEKIVSLLTNGNNLALISPRRIGKTELIRHCFAQPQITENYYTFIIDIYATDSLRDFVNVFGKAILDVLRSRGRRIWERFLNVLTSLRSEITFDIDGKPVWSLGLGAITNPTVTLEEIFTYLRNADKPCLIAIDEFQQITRYADGKNVEAALRTHIQQCPNAHFIFSGSQRHVMGTIFSSAARPFYQSVILLNLTSIPLDKYTSFATLHFEKAGKQLDENVMEELYLRFEGITYYLQRMLNYLFLSTPQGSRCTVEMIDQVQREILADSSDSYQLLLMQIPEKQRMVFTAIAREGKARAVSSGSFVKKYHLQSPSTVLSAVKGLLEKDLITQEDGAYCVYDRFFRLWLLQQYAV